MTRGNADSGTPRTAGSAVRGWASNDTAATRMAAAARNFRVATCDYGVTVGLGSSLAAQRPELKSVKSTLPFHGIAFMTNDAFGV